jgi:hypothetical protein
MTGREWRIVWRRVGWKGMQSRTYSTERHARALFDKLNSGGRPDLEPVVELYVDVRPVGRWKKGRDLATWPEWARRWPG